MTTWTTIGEYHGASKHGFRRYADGPGYLDWANQPDPFRRFDGARYVDLPLDDPADTPRYDVIFQAAGVAAQPLDRCSIGRLLQLSLAITAWKEYQGSRWALRANPSSGNLHPTEGYLVLPAIDGIGPTPAVYHYVPEEHGLEERTTVALDLWRELVSQLPPQAFLVGLTSIHWREAWKYGIRAYRYCQHDLGHALACVRIAAAAIGWQARELAGVGDATLASLLGTDRRSDFPREDRETPGLLMAVWPGPGNADLAMDVAAPAVAAIAAGSWQGQAAALSRQHVAWPWIERVSAACDKPDTAGPPAQTLSPSPAHPRRNASESAGQIIARRRSAQAMDPRGAMSRDAFYAMLCRLLPANTPPWDALAWPPSVSLGLFVHRVRDLAPGLYLLPRRPEHEQLFRAAARESSLHVAEGCPTGLPLFQLAAGDVCELAGRISCGQEIAADGAFSVAMLADWDGAAAAHGPWFYRRLFWETGAIGQMLYLEAEAADLRGTGIGCFYDDAALAAFGLAEGPFRSLYHFTVGRPLEDHRISTLPAYARGE